RRCPGRRPARSRREPPSAPPRGATPRVINSGAGPRWSSPPPGGGAGVPGGWSWGGPTMGVKAIGRGLALSLVLALATGARAADGPAVLDLWPGPAPGEAGKVGEEQAKTQNRDGRTVVTSLTNVSKPTLTVYRPHEGATRVAVVVCPGGGYNNLAWDHEG